MNIEELQGFYVTGDDGYTWLEYFATPDECSGEPVMEIDAGDTLVEIIEAAWKFKQDSGIA